MKKALSVGIVGGMGPASTADLFARIIKNTPAGMDQNHLKILVINDPTVPDRTNSLLKRGKNCLFKIKKSIKSLELLKADICAVCCITSHYYINNFKKNTNMDVVDIVEETKKYINLNYKKNIKIGLLATSGTIEKKIFSNYFKEENLLIPSKLDQRNFVMKAIYGKKGIKAGFLNKNNMTLIEKASRNLTKKGAELIILGCTELSLVISNKNKNFEYIDPVEILSKSIVKKAWKK